MQEWSGLSVRDSPRRSVRSRVKRSMKAGALVQTVVPLSMGRAIKLTTSRYFTPSGDSIHEVGITPDVFVDDTDGFPDLSLSGGVDREHDAQLIEAIGRLQGRQVMHSSAQ
jgi:carboxyl-terminal processing protease